MTGRTVAETAGSIEVEDLTKDFVVRVRTGRLRREPKTVAAVHGISLRVDAGEIIGYIGPNGAGKSTTIKMLTGILAPTSGRVVVAGLVPLKDRVALARRIGVVFGQRSNLWWDLPLADSFDLLRHIYRVEPVRHRQNLDRLVGVLDMGSFLQTPVRSLSLGQRMRGELVSAMLHDPDVLFLDEPTVGLDVVSKHALRAALRLLNAERGVTVVLTTHDLADVEELCPRLVIVDHGRVIYDGGTAALKDHYGGERTLIVDLEEARPALDVAGATCERVEGPRQWLRFSKETSAAAVLESVMQQAAVRDLTTLEPEIEDIVRRIYTGEA